MHPRNTKLSIIVPVFNEERTVADLLGRVLAAPPASKEVIVVNDGSTDATERRLHDVDDERVTVIHCPVNRGKGAAIREGLARVTGGIVIIQDADLEYDPAEYPRLTGPIERGEATVVYGSRIMGRNPMSSFGFYWGGRLVSLITNMLFGTRLTDEPTCYKTFRADVLQGIHLEYDDFRFCPEVTAKVIRLGHRIHEVPISYRPRKPGQGKKISWVDGFRAIEALLRFRFAPSRSWCVAPAAAASTSASRP